MGFEFGGGHGKKLAQKAAEIDRSVGALGQDFHAIAGGKNEAFIHARMLHQAAQAISQARFGNRQLLTDFHRRGEMVDADDLHAHEVTNL